MYIPKYYRMDDIETKIHFIEENSFGILVSNGEDMLHGTHLPFLVEKNTDGSIKLIGHMSKGNPQWREIKGDVLVVFSGPHAYVSPTWYEEEGYVPTWDYQAVHVYGKYIPKNSPEDLKEIMDKTIAYYEKDQLKPWNGNIPNHVYHRLINGVEGFNIEVNDIQGQWKLHQDHSEVRKKRVASALGLKEDQDAIKIAKQIMNNFK
ncbi:FMN-binding negative transcriptional regulator [Oceanobacillus neutriphilus]|uniref:Protease synthase and sporulation protein PAI 2 n=1 Tax=Oceanobacillus neutriphilus TaxID=531815 RepID=A0ABQ2NMQ3_9BACI|nr:FMN-binding negative transcriptional regulator [Oceanobacillus neutriphilus]GGP06834.1 protease synthase and sporulation protein PAI 2 [Oceanobacillus neutriphilus]